MNLKIGDTFTVTREVTEELVRRFAELSGDFNPLHLDEDFAAGTRFGQRIAHGMLTGAFISSVLGNELSEQKIAYLSQTMRFVAPVFIGDTVTVTATVMAIREDQPIVTVATECTKQTGQTVVSDEATVMVLD